MTIKGLNMANCSDILGYYVYRNCLVYMFMLRGQKRAGILRTYNHVINDSDIFYLDERYESIYGKPIEATQADFDYYRVSSKGHLTHV